MPNWKTFAGKVHRTWVQLLLENGYHEIVAIAVDTGIAIITDEWVDEYDRYQEGPIGVEFRIPASSHSIVQSDDLIKKLMERAMAAVIGSWLIIPVEEARFTYSILLIEPEEDWRQVVRELITNVRHPNQAEITAKVFSRNNQRAPLVYNEMKFGSKSEIRVAQELEERQILFFPLPLAVRAETGRRWQDHREVDFLICDEGAWGILEVSYHPNRYEKDAEKSAWFKKSGILCVEHYTAERCYKAPSRVVDEFLEILGKYKR